MTYPRKRSQKNVQQNVQQNAQKNSQGGTPSKQVPLRISVCQMRSSNDPWENLLFVNDRVNEATQAGAQAVFFPENVFYRGPKNATGFSRSDISLMLNSRTQTLEPLNEFSRVLSEMASYWKIGVSLGSVFESTGLAALPFNSHFWMDPSGSFTSYRKVHLFDYQSPTGASYLESNEVDYGVESVSVALQGHALGLSICYDLRFPELYRSLVLKKGAQMLAIPAAFTRETGVSHWHALLKARSIENLSFVIAAAQWGSHVNSAGQELHCFGHSAVYDPWGNLLCEAPLAGDELLIVDLDFENQEVLRKRMPALQNARFFQSMESDPSQTD